MPKVSVIIPVYNVEKYLRQCLDSVVNQTLKDIEIICVNDGSTDNSSAILEEYAQRDQRIKVITQENQGVAQARNKGIKLALGKYIGFVDSDDYIDNEMYLKMFKQAEKLHSDIVICNAKECKNNSSSNPYVINYFKKAVSLSESKNYTVSDSENIPKIDIYKMLLISPCHLWNKLYRKDFIQKHNIKFPARKCFEDCLFALRCLIESEKVSYVNNALYTHAVRDTSITTLQINTDKMIIETITELKQYIKKKKLSRELEFNLRYFINVNCLRVLTSLPESDKKAFLKEAEKIAIKRTDKNIFYQIRKKLLGKPIDLVYCWVNGNDTEWQKGKQYWQEKEGIVGDSVNDCRFIDNEELKYSLRSVAKNAPWINHIYIITNGQIPSWLDTNHPKITIVNQKDIMPLDALPTFNSEAIETCIANISNLSEYFLYANDDCFINKPIQPDFFYDKKGKPIIRLVKQNWGKSLIDSNIYCQNVIYSAELISKQFNKYYKYENSHNITPYRKSFYQECAKIFKDEYKKTCYYKFRTNNCVQQAIVLFYMLANKLAKKVIDRSSAVEKVAKTAYFTLLKPNDLKYKIKEYNPVLFCINDDENTNPENRKRLKSLLCELFPNIQEWEKPTDYQIKPAFKGENSADIVFCPDNKYTKYFGVLLQSIIDNSNSDKKYDILVFEKDISDNNKKLLLKMLPNNFSLRFIDITEYINENFGNLNFRIKNYWSISTFYRLFIPFVMKDYNRVLYLDSDMCTNYNIDELFSIDMEDKALLAVKDTVSPVLCHYKDREIYMRESLGLQIPENYFNAGMILFNIKNIDEIEYREKLLKAFQISNLWFLDQDILNIIFENNTKLIHNKWNYMWGSCLYSPNYLSQITDMAYKKWFCEAKNNPFIVHYTTPRKPWNNPAEEHADIFWHYARKTPFYEEIIYTNTQTTTLGRDVIKNAINRHKIYLQYIRCKLLKALTFGNKKEHYKNKVAKLKQEITDYRKTLGK